MKIAFFSDSYLDLTGGIISAINAEKKGLEKLGHTVYVFSSSFPKSKKERLKLAREHIYPVPSCKVFIRGITPISRRPKIIEKWILKNYPEIRDFEVFHIHYEAGCSIAGIRLARQLGIPVVQTMHGREDMGEGMLIPYGLRTFVSWNLNWFHSWYLPHKTKVPRDNYLATDNAKRFMWELMVNHANNADIVLTPSKHFGEKLRKYGVAKPMNALPNGFDDSQFIKNCNVVKVKDGEPLRIIWHSRVSAEKRMMVFLNALTKVHGKYIVDIYGGGGDYGRARRFAKRHNLNVNFYNTTPFKMIYKKLQSAHLDVLVSYGFDTFGMTLIEAASLGVPTLICDPDMKEILPNGSYVFTSSPDIDAIANSINELLLHPEKIEKMSKKLIDYRENVLQSKQTKKLLKIYEGLKK